MVSQDGMLTDNEVERLVWATLKGHPEGVSEDDLARMLDWATMQRVGAALVAMAIAGTIALRVQADGDVAAVSPDGGHAHA